MFLFPFSVNYEWTIDKTRNKGSYQLNQHSVDLNLYTTPTIKEKKRLELILHSRMREEV